MPIARVGDNDLYYELCGAPSGRPPAVLVMGLGTDAHGWELQVAALGGERQVLVMDNRGVGRSAKPRGPYTTAGLADDVAGVMDAAGVERAHVVGLSLGGMIVQRLALQHPDRVRSLALVATFARPDARAVGTADRGLSAAGYDGFDLGSLIGAMAQGRAELDFGQMFAFLMPLVFSPEFLQREAGFLAAFYARSMEYGLSARGFTGQLAAALSHDTTRELPLLRVPTAVITGTADRLIPPHHSREIAALVPGARLTELEGLPHGLNFEGAGRLNEALAAWMADNDGG